LLVGTKLDLTSDDNIMRALAKQNLAPVGRDQALKIVDDLKMEGYVECSGLTQAGVKAVFDEAAHLAVGRPIPKDKSANLAHSKQLKHTDSSVPKKRRCCIL